MSRLKTLEAPPTAARTPLTIGAADTTGVAILAPRADERKLSIDVKAQIWIGRLITGLMAAVMLLSAIPDVLRVPGAVSVFTHLGYPPYLLLFLGTAKTLGVAAVLVPGAPTIKEWAFAGLVFDLT